MLTKPPFGLFVTGTDTEIGKTYVSCIIVKALIAAGYRVGVYKPVASDCVSDGRMVVSEDAVLLWEAAGMPLSVDAVCPQRFQAPLAPHLAARKEGKELDLELARTGISAWADKCDIVVVEGAGGIMSPLGDEEYFADLAMDFGYPVVVVVDNRIGAINQALTTTVTASCFRDGLDVAGIVLNDAQVFEGDASRESNEGEIAGRSIVPVLARVKHESDHTDREIDWMALAKGELARASMELAGE